MNSLGLVPVKVFYFFYEKLFKHFLSTKFITQMFKLILSFVKIFLIMGVQNRKVTFKNSKKKIWLFNLLI